MARRVGFGISSKVAIAATTLTVVLRDGASGAGTIVDSWVFDLPAAIVSPPIVIREEISLEGSPATAMALEFTAGLANLNCYCTLSGYDAS